MRFHIITIFPHLFDSYLSDSILKKARDADLIEFFFYDPREYTDNKHRKVDDEPYGGGPGMIMTVQPIVSAWKSIMQENFLEKVEFEKRRIFKTIILSPGRVPFNTIYDKKLAQEYTDIILICGRYEGIDARVAEITGADLISIGEYVLTGGELAAMIICDSAARQVPGVLGNHGSLEEERISSHEVYTRPATVVWEGKEYPVPEVLLSGNHKKIDQWREKR